MGTALFKEDTLEFGAINKAVFLNISHCFKEDPTFGDIMRRFRNGTVSNNDIDYINQRYIDNDGVSLPITSKLRYVCDKNDERNSLDSTFLL